jgi:hypothetical protein
MGPAVCRLPELVILDYNEYFNYVAAAISSTFSQLGINHTVSHSVPASPNGTVPDASISGTFITFLTHDVNSALPPHYISYNFEQLTTDKVWPEQFWQRLR